MRREEGDCNGDDRDEGLYDDKDDYCLGRCG